MSLDKIRRSKFTVMVVRLNHEDDLKNSKPCKHCILKMWRLGVKKVFYSNEDGLIVRENMSKIQNEHVSHGTKYA